MRKEDSDGPSGREKKVREKNTIYLKFKENYIFHVTITMVEKVQLMPDNYKQWRHKFAVGIPKRSKSLPFSVVSA